MKITKPSQLREGMKLKGKWSGVPFSGCAFKTEGGYWHIMPYFHILCSEDAKEFPFTFTDLESVEGIRAAKEGDVLIDREGDERKVLITNDFVVIVSEKNIFTSIDAFTDIKTWQELEVMGWKLKDEPNPEADSATIGDLMENIKAEFDEFVEKVNKELEPID